MRQRDVAALDAKYTKELAGSKPEMMLCVYAAGRRRLHIKAVCQSVWSHHASGVDNAASWLADTAEWDYFNQRGWSLCKNNRKEPRSILMSSADRVLFISMAISMQLLWAIIIMRLPAEYKCSKVIKPSNPFTNVCWVSVLTTFSAPPQILAASTVFFCPIPEWREQVHGFWCYCCRFVLK